MCSSCWHGDHVSRTADLGNVIADPCEVMSEILGRGVATARLLGETLLDDPAYRRRNSRVETRDRLGLVLDDRGHRLSRARAAERLLARRDLIEYRSERELIRTEVHRI